MHRTHTCGEANLKLEGKTITLVGWADTIRDHGNVTFVDLRDRYGITQVVLDHKKSAELAETSKRIRKEFVLKIIGQVKKRPQGTEKKDLATGEIEIAVEKVEVITESLPLPIDLTGRTETNEDMMLKYRYLALRQPELQKNIIMRHKLVKLVRDYLDEKDFIEIETPILAKSTPEGARDYLVPSRVNPGKFFALPQSPQLFKQLIMIAGFDKYFQIARCFRDEDLRADRQPEFTQIDIEMSFLEQKDLMELNEEMMKRIWKQFLGIELKTPFPVMDYDEAMEKYGVDRPDTRFEMTLSDLTEEMGKSEFNAFNQAVQAGGIIKAIVVEGKADMSRKEISELENFVKIYRANGLANLKVHSGKLEGTIAKFFSEEQHKKILTKTKAKENDLILVCAGKKKIVNDSLGNLRVHLGKNLGLLKEGQWNFLWINDFPMFEWDETEGKVSATHHPFTSPKTEDIALLETEPLKMKANAYDLVLNGIELGGGSIRIHDPSVQSRVFKTIGLNEEEARQKFGFFLEAFNYGAPIHGGLAFGLDRLVMLITGAQSLREIIAFPKNKAAASLMDDSPCSVTEKQLKELHIALDLPEEKK